jgi:hypothetical protein
MPANARLGPRHDDAPIAARGVGALARREDGRLPRGDQIPRICFFLASKSSLLMMP